MKKNWNCNGYGVKRRATAWQAPHEISGERVMASEA